MVLQPYPPLWFIRGNIIAGFIGFVKEWIKECHKRGGITYNFAAENSRTIPTVGQIRIKECKINIINNHKIKPIIMKIFTTLAAAAMTLSASAAGTVLYENADAPMMNWDVAFEVSADQLAGLKGGDKFIATVAEAGASSEWPKFGFAPAVGEEIYPAAFEMWAGDAAPCDRTFEITEAQAEALKGGFSVKGTQVKVTKLVLEVGEAQLPGTLYAGESGLMNWSTFCTVEASQLTGLAEGDSLEINVYAYDEAQEWPQVYLEVAGEKIFNSALECFDKAVGKKTLVLTQELVDQLKGGFSVGAAGCGVDLVRLVKAGESAAIEIVDMQNAPVEYYNLQGVRVAEPQNGIYVRRQGNKVSKVVK